MRKRILVTGSARFWETDASRRARRLGADLADHAFRLTTGAEPGVDKAVAEGYCARARARGVELRDSFTQLKEPFRLRSWLNVTAGFDAGQYRRLVARSAWLDAALETCDASVMIGGHVGAFTIAQRFLDAGKPVFPMPFVPGRSDEVFQDILRNWLDRPVPGLTRHQFLRLALPWTGGGESLTELLIGALIDSPDIFLSYRRTDAGWAAGRLQGELAELFGEKRVFSDVTHIAGGEAWRSAIERAIEHAKVGIVVVGRDWLVPASSTGRPRLFEDGDVVRTEVRALLNGRKTVIVVLADAPPLARADLPAELASLTDLQAIRITHDTWREVFGSVLSAVRTALKPPPI
jgi:TIR domain